MKLRITRGDNSGKTWTLTEAWPRRLTGVIESMWCFEGDDVPSTVEQHLPNGLLELVVTASGRTSLAGLQTARTSIRPARTSRMLGIRLQPVGAYRVLQTRLHRTTDSVIDLRDVLGAEATDLSDLCTTAPTAEACLVGARAWVCARLTAAPPANPAVAVLVAAITERHGVVSIRQIETALSMSPRSVLELFKTQVGVTPKLYARLLRFRRALALLHEGRASVVEISLAAGYYDQPHLYLDFARFAGMTPGAFARAPRHTATTFAGP